MALARPSSEGHIRTPHSVSLKVLRLHAPVLSTPHALPPSEPNELFPIPSQNTDGSKTSEEPNPFILQPNLRLPSSFGAVHVGETFVCTLCVNNELPVRSPKSSKQTTIDTKKPTSKENSTLSPHNNETPSESSAEPDAEIDVANVTISAEMQTPDETAKPVKLDLEPSSDFEGLGTLIPPGETMQRLVRFHLSDEGTYVLAATVWYLETKRVRRRRPRGSSVGSRGESRDERRGIDVSRDASQGEGRSEGENENQDEDEDDYETISRSRSFRKLYQFNASQLLRVRVKTRILPSFMANKIGTGYAVEAQIEKLGDGSIVAESIVFGARPAFKVKSLNLWDERNEEEQGEGEGEGDKETEASETGDGDEGDVKVEKKSETARKEISAQPILNTGNVLQAAFLLLRHKDASESSSTALEYGRDGRVALGQISISWRGPMGEAGSLSTGLLSTKAA